MSSVKPYTATATWKTALDPCPECNYLQEQVYPYEPESAFLVDPMMGQVWNFDLDQPLTHGGEGENCQCGVEINVTFDFSRLAEAVSFMRHGKEVTVYRSVTTGRFVKGGN